jgi:hypothetical protein
MYENTTFVLISDSIILFLTIIWKYMRNFNHVFEFTNSSWKQFKYILEFSYKSFSCIMNKFIEKKKFNLTMIQSVWIVTIVLSQFIDHIKESEIFPYSQTIEIQPGNLEFTFTKAKTYLSFLNINMKSWLKIRIFFFVRNLFDQTSHKSQLIWNFFFHYEHQSALPIHLWLIWWW